MNNSCAFEVNFDGIVGPTHNYAGLSFGNVASAAHEGQRSSPRQAALQGLKKAWALAQMGLKQAVLPPQERPHMATLRRLGFTGKDEGRILAQAARHAPQLLAAVSSASCMWVANAATISPYPDTTDGKTHITPANLCSMLHRSIEAPTTGAVLRAIFSDESFVHHPVLPATTQFADEGAANHMRFCDAYGSGGVELFVYGDDLLGSSSRPATFPARQTLPTCQVIARSHRLRPHKTIFAQQSPQAIDAGVFHNDVIAVGNQRLLFYHELAFADTGKVRQQLDTAMGAPLDYIEVPAAVVSLEEAVTSYLFNSQLVSLPDAQGVALIAPSECRQVAAVHDYLQQLQQSNPLLKRVHYFDLHQSMHNGGGPACLRLRVVMSDRQIASCPVRVFLNAGLYQDLCDWVRRHYRNAITADDLRDPALLDECRSALDELSQLLKLGPVYDFQRN